jgi:hypothetical protein
MPKTTIADLEKAIVEQHGQILALIETVATLTEGTRVLNERLNNAGRVIKSMQADLDSRRPTTRVQAKPQANPWFVAINQLRQERGLVPTAWVPREDVLHRMEQNAGEAHAEACNYGESV